MTATSIPDDVGPYRIQREIGRGGMGVVYLARDTKLDRDVAIKVLPADLSHDPERLTRFEREARLLASLNQANIAAVHGLEVLDDVRYLILEYVDGEDLSDRLAAGALPLDEALHIAKQIARAVESAHANGVIHRDLKPANVKVTVDGDVKVLDFGLAKALHDQSAAAGGLAQSPTVVPSQSPTTPGIVLGTAGYMSPEQARGKPIDKRSDIWSFGCILYEMLTGKCPFPGESVTESLGATIHKEPDWAVLPDGTPPNVQLLLHRCLQKDRSRRLQDIGDARVELDDTLSGSTSLWTRDAQLTAPAASRRPGLPWLALAAVLLLAAVVLSSVVTRLAAPRASLVRAFVLPPPETSFVPYGDLAGPAVISPDGKTLAFTAMGDDETRRIWVRPLRVAEARELAGTDDANFPFWSGDGRSIGFFTEGLLKRVDLNGGSPITVCEAPGGRGGTWNADGDILFAPDFATAIYRVPATGGVPEPITVIDTDRHTSHRWPSFLPDGRHFLYSAIHAESSRSADNAICFSSLDGGSAREVMRSSLNAHGTDEHLLFVREGTLMAAPFDAAEGVIEGDPEPVAVSVAYNLATWKAAFSCSGSRIIAYNPGGLMQGEGTRITTYDRDGNELKVVSQVTSGGSLTVSPDGKHLAYTTGRAASSMDVWVHEIARDLPRRLTFLSGFEDGPVWSPDGTELFFGYRYRTGGDAAEGLYRISVSGGPPTLVLSSQDQLTPISVSHDGRYILLSATRGARPQSTRLEGRSSTGDDLWVLPLSPLGEPVAILEIPAVFQSEASFSPDGYWILFTSDESGMLEAYVTQFIEPSDAGGAPRVRGKWQISNGGAWLPRWSRDGSELYFHTLDGTIMAVAVSTESGRLDLGTAEPLFRVHIGMGNAYDVTPEGHFVVTSADETTTEPVALILNWTSELGE